MGSGGGLLSTEAFRAGPLTFVVRSTDAQVLLLAEELFRDLAPSAADSDTAAFVLTPSDPTDRGLFQLSGPVVGTMSDLSLPEAVTRMVSAISRATLDLEPGRLHLHAAAAVRSGRAVIMTGPRESGKTTTLSKLAVAGWEFISDEALAIGADSTKVAGFAKPLSVKPGGRALVPELVPHLRPGECAPGDVLHVALGAVGATSVPDAEPAVVAFLNRDMTAAHATATVRSLAPADAVVRLMGETMDAGRYGRRAVTTLSELAARCRCAELTVGDLESTAQVVEQELDASRSGQGGEVEELTGGLGVSPHVVSVRIDDRVVIHELRGGRILALDPAGTRVWLHLGRWDPSDDIDVHGPGVRPFVEQLRGLGLLETEPSR